MSRLFKLETVGGHGSIAPSTGEELGEILATFAATEMEKFVANPNAKVAHWGDRVAQLFHLAADAYEAGAAVTIGHNRSDRYLMAAKRHRSMGDELTNQAKLFRDNEKSASLMIAFQHGYEGLNIDRYSFESRKAFQLGNYYAVQGFEIPECIKHEWVQGHDGGDLFIIDDHKYKVDYPSGKVINPQITLID
jgi:hypothetical protein